MSRARALDVLAATDARLRTAHGVLGSLCPGRAHATPLVGIAERLLTEDTDGDVAEAFANALTSVLRAQSESFPNNLFWDFDFPAAELFRVTAAEPADARDRAEQSARRIVALQGLYGVQSCIRFQYAHDFIYGFDWARWVKRRPEERAGVGPFDGVFLDYLLERGHELVERIEHDDSKYPRLRGQESRNVFRFVRDPPSEKLLYSDLAERGLLPVQAWRSDAVPEWTRPYTEIRQERARALGL